MNQNRFKISRVTLDDLLELEMAQIQAEIELRQIDLAVQQANYQLNIFLGLEKNVRLELDIPTGLPDYKVDLDLAINHAKKKHPNIIHYLHRKLEAQQQVDRTKKENRFQLNLRASFGVNQQTENLSGVYTFPMAQQQRVLLSLDIPILDWGKRKGQYEMAKSNQEVLLAEVAQELLDFEQKVRIQVLNFNMLPDLVRAVETTQQIAIKRFNLTRQRYITGGVDLVKLNISLESRNQARITYLNALHTYWEAYCSLRAYTLYDFETQKELELSPQTKAVFLEN